MSDSPGYHYGIRDSYGLSILILKNVEMERALGKLRCRCRTHREVISFDKNGFPEN